MSEASLFFEDNFLVKYKIPGQTEKCGDDFCGEKREFFFSEINPKDLKIAKNRQKNWLRC